MSDCESLAAPQRLGELIACGTLVQGARDSVREVPLSWRRPRGQNPQAFARAERRQQARLADSGGPLHKRHRPLAGLDLEGQRFQLRKLNLPLDE